MVKTTREKIAMYGYRPSSNQNLVLLPKNGGNTLKSTEGATANYGGNTKFGLYPNVGMSYLFQNKIGVGSLFYNTTTPSQVNPPQSNSQAGASSPSPHASHPGLVEETNNSITFTFPNSDAYGVIYVNSQGTFVADGDDDVCTTSGALLWDFDLSNKELMKATEVGYSEIKGTTNSPLVESDFPVYIFIYQTGNGNIYMGIEVYDEDSTANYQVSWTQANNNNLYQNMTLESTTDSWFHQPPDGLTGFWATTLSFVDEGINVYEGSGGVSGNTPLLPINFSTGSTNNTPLKITITKTN